MNKYEFYSKLLQEDFPVKYRQDFAEHDSQQCKKIQDLRVHLEEAVGLLRYIYNHNELALYENGRIEDFLARHAQGDEKN